MHHAFLLLSFIDRENIILMRIVLKGMEIAHFCANIYLLTIKKALLI